MTLALPDWNADDLAAAAPMLDAAAANAGVPRAVLYAIVAQESRFVPSAINTADQPPSYGLMQLKLATAQAVGYGSDDPSGLLDPATNLAFGSAYLAQLIATYGLGDAAYAAYNGGLIGGQIVGSAQQYVADVDQRISYFQGTLPTGLSWTDVALAGLGVLLLLRVVT